MGMVLTAKGMGMRLREWDRTKFCPRAKLYFQIYLQPSSVHFYFHEVKCLLHSSTVWWLIEQDLNGKNKLQK